MTEIIFNKRVFNKDNPAEVYLQSEFHKSYLKRIGVKFRTPKQGRKFIMEFFEDEKHRESLQLGINATVERYGIANEV